MITFRSGINGDCSKKRRHLICIPSRTLVFCKPDTRQNKKRSFPLMLPANYINHKWNGKQIGKTSEVFSFFPAPETQTQSVCSILSDMFSLGMVICAIFNNGRPLIQAGNSSSAYLKQLELVSRTEYY